MLGQLVLTTDPEQRFAFRNPVERMSLWLLSGNLGVSMEMFQGLLSKKVSNGG